jgi:spermidine synthase
MSGLAIGNALAARYGDYFSQPIRLYALAELLIGLTGVGLIYLLPVLGSALAPLLSPWIDHPWVINPIRLFCGFILLLIPASAMGLTLPLLTKVLISADKNFGSVLGDLYGWNTAGAVLGVVISEIYLITYLGIHGTGFIAGGLNFVAASVAMGLSGKFLRQPDDGSVIDPKRIPLSQEGHWLGAAFLTGFCLLALEVIWFRFLALFIMTTTVAFALMLAIVLAGIAAGGFMGSLWLRRKRDAYQYSNAVSFLAGAFCVIGYAGFSRIIRPFEFIQIQDPLDILRVGIPLMFPVSFLSGVFFIFMGAGLQAELKSEMQTTGSLTLVNTLGAALGSLLGGFVLLPTFGMERSFRIVAMLYGGVGFLLWLRKNIPFRSSCGAAIVWGLTLFLFPSGVMIQQHLWAPVRRLTLIKSPVIEAIREGLTETIIYLKINWYGKLVSHLMLTNSFSMSGTGYQSRRYMKLYVYLPVAVHPNLKTALLISYGVGNTAKALTDTRSLERIDIVDISRDILNMNSIIYPNPAERPLNDPRVHVHIEDGRYFLQTTNQHFDLITGEPPPPTAAGVVNLYTREYFELMYRRLSDGGMVTYWLPMHNLSEVSAKSVMKSFCDVFADYSLWTGMGPQLMMMGTRNAQGPVSEEFFTRQWNDSLVAEEMKHLGFEKPEQLGSLFIADADYFHDFLKDALPLVDNYPKRILAEGSMEGLRTLSLAWTDTTAARERFRRSALIKRLWPEHIRSASLPYFDIQNSLNMHFYNPTASIDLLIPHLHRVLLETRLRAPVFWFLGSNADQEQLLQGENQSDMNAAAVQYLLGVRALSDRHFDRAADHFKQAEDLPDRGQEMFRYRIYALCLSGQIALAQHESQVRLLESIHSKAGKPESILELSPYWQWMKTTFGLDPLAGK